MISQELLHHKIVRSSNSKKWIVFVHGAGGNIHTWKYQINDFRSHFNLLLLDLRDHGLSKFENVENNNYSFELISSDIKKVMDHIGIKKAHFVTLSMGSVIIQDFMLRYQNHVDQVVFAGGVFKVKPVLKLFIGAFKLINHLLSYERMYRIVSYILMPKKHHQKARRIYQLQARKLTQREYLRWVGLYRSFFKLLRDSFNYHFNHDQLVIMGSEDYMFLKSARHFVANQANAQLDVISSAGHICNIEQYDAFNKIAFGFLRE